MAQVSGIRWTTIGTQDLARNVELFSTVVGLEVIAEQHFSGATWEMLWQLPQGTTGHGLLLQKPGIVGGGVRLVEFDPPSPVIVREGAAAWDTGAIKILDLIVNDHARATELFDTHGFTWRSPAPNRYPLPDGSKTLERHIETEDGIILGIPQVFGQSRSAWVAADDAELFSEATNSSYLVNDLESSLRFYRDVLGLRVMADLSITSEELQKLIGLPEPVTLRMAFLEGRAEVGPGASDAYTLAGKIGLLNYSGITGSSLRDKACPPHRGVIMVTFQTDNLKDLAARLETSGAEISGTGTADLPPYGVRQILTARAPDGLFLEFFA